MTLFSPECVKNTPIVCSSFAAKKNLTPPKFCGKMDLPKYSRQKRDKGPLIHSIARMTSLK